MPTPNPFSAPKEQAPLIKVLAYGPSGIGKTWFALAFPGPIAVIDTEMGTAHYGSREGLSRFDVISTKSYLEAKKAVDWLASGDHQYKTVVVDPITVLYEVLQEAASVRRASKSGVSLLDTDLQMLDWARIKSQWKALMTSLTNLPVHVVAIARQKDLMEKRGDEMVKVGVKFDAEKSADYAFDVVLRFGLAKPGTGDASADGVTRAALVEKDRTPNALPLGSAYTNPTFETLFGEYVRTSKGTAVRVVPDESAAAARDAGESLATADKPTPAQVVALVEALEAAGQDPEVIKAQVAGKGQPWSALTVRQVTSLTERAIKAAASKAAPQTPPEPTAAPPEAAAGEPTPVPSAIGESGDGADVPASPSPDAAPAPTTSRRRSAAAPQPVEA